jgi:hypothetical protein
MRAVEYTQSEAARIHVLVLRDFSKVVVVRCASRDQCCTLLAIVIHLHFFLLPDHAFFPEQSPLHF